jgi:chitodextrinase
VDFCTPDTVANLNSQLNITHRKVPPLLEISAPVAAGGAGVVLSFAAGLTPNTDYTVTLIARDTAGNCQRAFTRVPVHTADNAPPVTLALRAANVTGSTAQLRIALDEPGIAFYSVARAAAAGDSACPPAAELFALGAGGGPGGRNSSVVVPARSPVEAVVQLRGLASETTYAACVVAYDATSQHNRQTTRQRVAFTTLDVTPPTPTLAVAPAGDGGDVACSRVPPYLCNLTWSAALSEPGAARWALARNGSWALPLPAAVLMADVAADSLFPNGAVVAEGSLNFPPSPSGPINLTGLDSGIGYVLVLAARDAATPTPNIAPALVLRAIIAPDVTPPVFLEARTDAATDTSLDLAVRLDEDGTTFFVLVPHPSDVPTVAEVLQGVAAGGAAAAATNSTTSAANATAALRAAGLQPGQLFDAHLAAVDAAGNRQLNVTTLR